MKTDGGPVCHCNNEVEGEWRMPKTETVENLIENLITHALTQQAEAIGDGGSLACEAWSKVIALALRLGECVEEKGGL